MSDVKKVLEMIKEQEVKYVDFRFTDPRGKWQHLAHHVRTVDEDLLTDGIMFDGSSIAGWKAINESDMTLMPDLSTAVIDPFAAQTSLIIFCDIAEPAPASPIRATRARPPRRPKPISARPASATRHSSAPRPSSSCSMTCAISRA